MTELSAPASSAEETGKRPRHVQALERLPVTRVVQAFFLSRRTAQRKPGGGDSAPRRFGTASVEVGRMSPPASTGLRRTRVHLRVCPVCELDLRGRDASFCENA